MIRTTHVTPGTVWSTLWSNQDHLDTFWNFIENHYEEEWRVQADGSLILTVDSDMLDRVLLDNYAAAWIKYGTFRGGQTAEGKKFLIHRPEYLMGEYIIKGVYDEFQRLVNGERTYYFTQGA